MLPTAAFSRSSIESKIKASPESLPLTLLVDNVRIPDNLGALLRVAAAAGARRAICLRGCANPWGPKALRAAAGAHFRIPLVCDVSWDKVHWHLAGTNPKVIAQSTVKPRYGDSLTTCFCLVDSSTLNRGYSIRTGRLCSKKIFSKQKEIDYYLVNKDSQTVSILCI